MNIKDEWAEVQCPYCGHESTHRVEDGTKTTQCRKCKENYAIEFNVTIHVIVTTLKMAKVKTESFQAELM